ncbi:MAG: T9SS type A sorting domain-containing protein [Saprospiraceae bacterium]|nr:T9SS type A sorting domain-containing protein [Saprospiraceae bacterium]
MKQHILILVLAMIFFDICVAQPTFNRRFDFGGYPHSIFTSLAVTDTAYYATTVITDTANNNRAATMFVKLNLQGEVIHSKVFSLPNKSAEAWQAYLIETAEGSFVTVGYEIDVDGYDMFMIEFNAWGDTIRYRTFKNPYFPESHFFVPQSIVQTEDGGFLVVSHISLPGPHNPQLLAIKTDRYFNVDWQREYGNNWLDNNNCTITDSDGGYLLGGIRANINLVPYNGTWRMSLLKIDSEGNEIWEYLTPFPELWYKACDIIQTEDGGLVVATGNGYRQSWPSGVDSITMYFLKHVIIKLNSNLEEEWTTPFRSLTHSPENKYNRMVRSTDGLGYVAAGEADIPDTLSLSRYMKFGWLTKVSEQGDSLWARYLEIVQSESDSLLYGFQHALFDIKPCPDGGYLLCGYSVSLVAPPYQRAWILKVDEYGCLVPGCQGIIDDTGTPATASRQPVMLLYPNPASDFLHVYIRDKSPGETITSDKLEIYDTQGRKLLIHSAPVCDATYSINVQNFPPGIYTLNWVRGNQTKTTKQWVKN